LVNEATWECSGNGITLQAMDSSHVALVSLVMRSEGFESYRCDRNMSLGISLVRYSYFFLIKFCLNLESIQYVESIKNNG